MSKGNERTTPAVIDNGWALRRLPWAVVTALVKVLAVAPPVAAQGYPVIDSAAVAEAAETLKAAGDQVRQMTAILNQVQSILDTVGKEGLPTVAFQETLSQSGVSQFSTSVTSLLDAAAMGSGSGVNGPSGTGSTGPSFGQILGKIDSLKGQASIKPDFSDFPSALRWVNSELAVGRGASVTETDLARQARGMLAGEAAANGYALALSAHVAVAQAAGRVRTLAQQAADSTNLRGDMAANTAVMLAMHDELAQVQALMTAVLEVQASSRLAELDPAVSAAGIEADGWSNRGVAK